MRRRRGGGGAPCDEPRPPISNAPSNRRSEVVSESTSRVAYRGNGDLPAPVIGEWWTYYCSPCAHRSDARFDGKRWRFGSSHVDRCPKQGECLTCSAAWLADTTGLDVRPPMLLDDPRPFLLALGELDDCPPARGGTIAVAPRRTEEPRPDTEWFQCVRELRAFHRGRAAASYLRSRAVDPRLHDLGYVIRRGYDAISARGYSGSEVVTEAFRSLDPRARKHDLLSGCPVGWIGAPVPPEGELVLLVAGFVDGFSARQRGFPAVSSIGTSLPDHLLADLAGKTVAVAYDVGEEKSAERTTTKLRAAGNEAFVVHLAKLGLPPKGDLADYFAGGGSRDEMVRLIQQERKDAE